MSINETIPNALPFECFADIMLFGETSQSFHIHIFVLGIGKWHLDNYGTYAEEILLANSAVLSMIVSLMAHREMVVGQHIGHGNLTSIVQQCHHFTV